MASGWNAPLEDEKCVDERAGADVGGDDDETSTMRHVTVKRSTNADIDMTPFISLHSRKKSNIKLIISNACRSRDGLLESCDIKLTCHFLLI